MASEQPPSGVTAEGGATVYGAFGRVCSIFLVLLFRGFLSNELLKVAFTGTFPLVANSFSVSYGKSTKAPPPSPAAIFALNLYFFIALPVFSPRSPQSPGIETFGDGRWFGSSDLNKETAGNYQDFGT
jgi:hypothetical protein